MLVTHEEKKISIGLIDNYMLMRRGLSMIFHECFEHVRVNESTSVDEFSKTENCADADVILLGVNNFTKEECLAKVIRLKAAFPYQKLVVYDDHLDYNLIVSYFQVGINGYVRSNNGKDELLRCIENVMLGRFHLCPELTRLLLNQLTSIGPKSTSLKELSGRESEIARYLCQGIKTSSIAKTLSRKASTISTIKHRIFRKMNVKNVVELATAMEGPFVRSRSYSLKPSIKF